LKQAPKNKDSKSEVNIRVLSPKQSTSTFFKDPIGVEKEQEITHYINAPISSSLIEANTN
jgi:hypothetical protein